MVIYCCVPLCFNNAKVPGETFHTFPKCEKLKDIWIFRIGRDDLKRSHVPTSTRVCSRHFLDTDYRTESHGLSFLRKRLLPGAVPCRFPKVSSSNLTFPQGKLNLSSDEKTSNQASAMEDIPEIVPAMKIKAEPLDDYFERENTQSYATEIFKTEMQTFETVPIKVEQEDLTTLPPTSTGSFTCMLCLTEFPTHNSLKNHFLSLGKFHTCRKALEMNQPMVNLVRVDFQYKKERRVDDIKVEVEQYDPLVENQSEMWDYNYTAAAARPKQIPLKHGRRLADRSRKILQKSYRPPNHKLSKRFACTMCPKNFSQNYILNQHVKLNHRLETIVRRKGTEKRFVNKQKVGRFKSICSICSRIFQKESILLAHHTEMHSESASFRCNFCNGLLLSTTECLDHCRRCPFAAWQRTCFICLVEYCDYNRLITHFQAKHPDLLPFKCKTCNYKCNDIVYLCRHARGCTGVGKDKHFLGSIGGRGKITCPICSYKFSCNTDLCAHYLGFHMQSDSLCCKICSSEFMHKEPFAFHSWVCLLGSRKSNESTSNAVVGMAESDINKKESSAVKSLLTNLSKIIFTKNKLEDRIIKRLTPGYFFNMQLKCTVCLRNFESSSTLAQHFELVHVQQTQSENTERCFVCLKNRSNEAEQDDDKPIRCRRTFACKIILRKPIPNRVPKSRNGSAAFLCAICGKWHGLMSQRRENVCMGSGFFCFSCTKKFVAEDATRCDVLQSHPEMSRACDKCIDKFAASITLVDHLTKVHSVTVVYFCFVCSTVFSSEAGLFDHLNEHSDENEEETN